MQGSDVAAEDPAGNGAAGQDAAGLAEPGLAEPGLAEPGLAEPGLAEPGPAGAGPAQAGDNLPDQVRRVRYSRIDGARLPAATLVRPDGYVAWACGDQDAESRARAARAVRSWCGPA